MDLTRRMPTIKAVLAAALACFVASIAQAPAQPVTAPIPTPAPIINPPAPSTVPQPPPVPVSPSLPSSGPGAAAVPPANESVAPINPGPHRRATVSYPTHAHHHYGRHVGYGAVASYRPPLDYYGPYCSWSPGWDFYWHPVCTW
jgi:hypothetical protein